MAAISIVGSAAVVIGLMLLADTTIGVDWSQILPALAGQLPVTLPAAVLVLAATAVNLVAGALVARSVIGRAFHGAGELVLAAFTGAVLLDVVVVMGLGALDLVRWPVLALVHLAIIGASWVARSRIYPLARLSMRRPTPLEAAAWLLVALVWIGPILFQLGAPVVSFNDVPANHVAPPEHLRAYGSLDPLDTSPSPRYAPSRNFLGYIALHGTIATMTDLTAAQSVVAFVLPLTILVGVAVHRLASVLFGAQAGYWALVATPLTFVFLRIPDSRATATVFPIALFALVSLWRVAPTLRRRDYALVAGALGAAILVHPLVGAFAWATAGVLVLARPDRYGANGIPALACAAVLSLPQVSIMLSLSVPAAAGLLPVLWAVALGLGLEPLMPRLRNEWIAAARLVVVATVVVAALLTAPPVASGVVGGLAEIAGRFPLLSVAAALSVPLVWRRPGLLLAASALGAWLIGSALLHTVPLPAAIAESFRFEIPKTYAYWVPIWLAALAAGGLSTLLRHTRLAPAIRYGLAATFVLAAALPIRADVIHVSDPIEHRLAETLSISAGQAQRGYWQGYPDARHMIDLAGRGVAEHLRDEQQAGRLTSATGLLHIADYPHEWEQIPISVFTGAVETLATLEPYRNIHTDVERQLHVDEIGPLLGPAYPYVVLEAAGLPTDPTSAIESAGYVETFRNERAVVYRLREAAAAAGSRSRIS